MEIENLRLKKVQKRLVKIMKEKNKLKWKIIKHEGISEHDQENEASAGTEISFLKTFELFLVLLQSSV